MVSNFIFILFFFIILTPPVLCYVIARNDDRNSLRWFWYGLFFGIFATIYLVFYTKEGDQDKIEPRVMVLLCIFMLLILYSLYETIF